MQKELCKKLEEIKKNNPTNYEKVNKVLRFIYKTIQSDYFETRINNIKISDSARGIGCSAEYQHEIEKKNTLFQNYIESNKGIVKMLFEIVKDEDQRFFDYLMNKIDVPITMFENGISCNTESFQYIYNLYVMLKTYETKHDFDIFKNVCDDIADLFIDKNIANYADNNRKSLIDRILNNEFFPKTDLLRGLLIKVITEKYTNDETDNKRLNSMFMFLGELTRDKRKYEKLGCIGYTIKPETFDIIANDISLLVHKDLLPGCEPFYDPIILFKDRYKVLKEEIKRIGVNHREEVYSYFVSICPGLFDELNQGRDEDIFNECVKKIFDSDTYYELYRNLEALSKADEFYQNGRKEAAFDRIKDILSGNYKTAVLGHVLSFTNENNNKIEKPSSISERTKTLYLKHDLVPPDFNWDILESTHFPLESLKNRLDAEAYEHNAAKQIAVLEEQNQSTNEQSKQKKKSRFNIFG